MVIERYINVKHQFMAYTEVCGTRVIYTNYIALFRDTAILLVV